MSKPFTKFLEEAAKPQSKSKSKAKADTRPSVAALIAAGWSKESAEKHGR